MKKTVVLCISLFFLLSLNIWAEVKITTEPSIIFADEKDNENFLKNQIIPINKEFTLKYEISVDTSSSVDNAIYCNILFPIGIDVKLIYCSSVLMLKDDNGKILPAFSIYDSTYWEDIYKYCEFIIPNQAQKINIEFAVIVPDRYSGNRLTQDIRYELLKGLHAANWQGKSFDVVKKILTNNLSTELTTIATVIILGKTIPEKTKANLKLDTTDSRQITFDQDVSSITTKELIHRSYSNKEWIENADAHLSFLVAGSNKENIIAASSVKNNITQDVSEVEANKKIYAKEREEWEKMIAEAEQRKAGNAVPSAPRAQDQYPVSKSSQDVSEVEANKKMYAKEREEWEKMIAEAEQRKAGNAVPSAPRAQDQYPVNKSSEPTSSQASNTSAPKSNFPTPRAQDQYPKGKSTVPAPVPYYTNQASNPTDSDNIYKFDQFKIKTVKDSGYDVSRQKEINKDDPHFGWYLGAFYLKGFTEKKSDPDTKKIIFLKNTGDQLYFWFNLEQDIFRLNDKASLSISEDKNGYDTNWEIDRQNFGHGTLIVSHKGYQNITKTRPYTDYLYGVRKNANTSIIPFEEGEYFVVLDYEIEKEQLGKNAYYNYKTGCSFYIYNGDCMVFPFDTETGSELTNNCFTPNGFYLDFAKSYNLKIRVQRETLPANSNSFDIRFNRPAKDKEKFTEEGIYTITALNQYTGLKTTKIIYVGDKDNKILKTYAEHPELTISEIKKQLGYE